MPGNVSPQALGQRVLDRAEPGWDTFSLALEATRRVLGDRLVAAYAIGSLAHRAFRPLVSDVDVMLLLDDCDEETVRDVGRVERLTVERTSADMAGRVSFFFLDAARFADPPPTARAASIQRLDLLRNGVLAYGDGSVLASAREPAHAEVIAEMARLAIDRLRAAEVQTLLHDSRALLRAGVPVVTKLALLPIRCLFTLHTGQIASPEAAVRWWAKRPAPGIPLALAASTWRRSGIADEEQACVLLDEHLSRVYAELLDDFIHEPAIGADLQRELVSCRSGFADALL
jgi:predicted nucleotidyltransferase